MSSQRGLYLGVDISTQQVKLILIDESLRTVFEDAVKFDTDLSEFGTVGGAHISEDKLRVTSPTLMWVKAIDMILGKMKQSNINFGHILAVSGTGQQHGSVYWKTGAKKVLQNFHSEKSMWEQLSKPQICFSVPDSPIWMDSSTTKQCKKLEEAVGGPNELAKLTGSRAYERFTGNQIAKIYQESGSLYEDTERISLVSSFGASLFIGDYAPIDYADGSGMNLMDILKKCWSEKCLDACAPMLKDRLSDLVPSKTCVGKISQYMVDRYGFSPSCEVIAFTGDNPASLAGMRLKKNEVIVSLGTSDTLFLWLTEPIPAVEGHIFVNPVDSSAYMALLCYKNGSLIREKLRNDEAGGDWKMFENMLKTSPKGNNGNIGMFYDIAEITPLNASGMHRFNRENKPVEKFLPEEEVRGLIEGQFLAKRVHAENLGYCVTAANSRILATGGASASTAILQVLADVFNSPVFTLDIPNSASLGCAYRAKHGHSGHTEQCFTDVVKNAPEFTCTANPDPEVREVYDKLTIRFRDLEKKFIRKN